MDSKPFIDRLQARHSKEVARQIVQDILEDNERMQELMDCFFHDELRVCQRASWPVGMISDYNKTLIRPYIKKMIDNLEFAKHDAVIRNTFRTFQHIDIPEEVEGEVFEKAFEYLIDLKVPVGIRVFAMSTCTNIALKYPELKDELIPVIQEHLPHGTPGYRSRGKREIARMQS